MRKKLLPILLFLFLLLIPTSLITIPIPSVPARGPEPIGYEIIGDVVEIWNPDTTYYFNKTSGIQWTEDPNAYWTRNVFAIGYYSGGEWHKIFSADELGTFERSIESDFLTYVNATLWKDFNYAGYDLRLGIRYHLKLNDKDLSVIIYAKNIGDVDYPYPLGFMWEVTDINIPNSHGTDTIFINETDYRLDGVFDETFTNMNRSWYRIFDWTQFITLEWDNNTNYSVRLQCNGILEEAKVTWMVNGGIFLAGQQKSTTLFWADAEGDYTGVHFDLGGVAGDTIGLANNETHMFILDNDDEEVYIFTIAGVYTTVHWNTAVETTSPGGITCNTTHIFISDFNDAEIYIYEMDGTYKTSFDTSGAGADNLRDLGNNGTHIFTTDFADDEVYWWTITGTYVNSFNTGGQSALALPLTTDGTYIWILDITDKEVYRYTMAGVFDGQWDTSVQSDSSVGMTTNGESIWVIDDDDEEVYKYEYLTTPTLTSTTFTDMDNGDNCYKMNQWYTLVGVVDDPGGAADIANISIRGITTGVVFEVRGYNLDGVAAYDIVSNDTEIDLDSGSCGWSEDGDEGTLTLKIRFEWDFTDASNLELNMTAMDTDANTPGWTEMQADYFDVIGRLVTTGVSTNTSYPNAGTGVQITGTVYYATTVGGDVASTSYPPDAQFTDVAVHNATNDEEATDTTIVNGAFSINFTCSSVVGTYIYHLYGDLVADYSDVDFPDGDTITIYVISAIAMYSFDQETSATIATDTGGLGNDGTISGATRAGRGIYGRGMIFDGTDDYIEVTQSSSLNITGSIALMVWVNTSDTGVQGLIVKDESYGLTIMSNYAVRFTINSTNLDTVPNIFTANTPTHIAGVYNGTHMLIYIDAVLEKSSAMTGVINKTISDLFLGNTTTNFFNGMMDEIRILSNAPSTANMASYRNDPISTFPYNLQGSITDMECTNWVFAGEAYDFTGEFVRQNATYPFDIFSFRFTDGVSWTVLTFDLPADEWTLSSNFAYSMVNEVSYSGNVWNVTWGLYLTEDIFDMLNADIQMRVNDTDGNTDAYEVVEEDYFDIYNHGGMSEYEDLGDGISVAGEGVFGLAAENSSHAEGGSWSYANITWRKLQHVGFLVHVWQGTAFDTDHWDCPSEHNDTAQVEYGINYWYDGDWVEGWKVRLVVKDGKAGTYGIAVDEAWVEVNVSWYNRDVLTDSDLIYVYYEAINSTDTSTQFAVYIDLWVGIEGGSSTVGGRVGAEYFGMSETGWGPWATWRPVSGLEDESIFADDLLDESSAVISAEELELFLVWANLTKTSNQTGSDPGCDTHQWGLIDYTGPFWRTLSPTDVMRGISAPIPIATITPGEVSAGFFSALITAMIDGITKPIVAALGGGASTLYFVMATILDSAFSFFIPGFTFVSSITTMVVTYGGYFAASLLNMTTLVVQMFRLVTVSATTIFDWLTRMLNFLFILGGYVGGILDGTSTMIGGLSNMWDMMEFHQWVDFVPVLGFVYWINSIDQRARRMGGGWMSIFIGDLQMASFILSFFVEWMSRVIGFVTDMVFRLINAIKI